MTERLRAVALEANRSDWLSVTVDTTLRGVLRLPERLFAAPAISRSHVLRRLIGQRYEHLSYMADWRDAFAESPLLDLTLVNIANLVAYRAARRAIREADLVVVLHSACGDNLSLINRTAHWLQARRGKLAVFIGNEYDLMDEKKQFIRESGADYICSQLPIETARWLYGDCTGAHVLAMPHALNPAAYHDLGQPRTIDIGFIGDLYDRTIGDRERTDLIRWFEEHEGGRRDIRLNRRVSREAWNQFLNGCRGIIGAESGSYYLDRKAKAIECAKKYQRANPSATFEEVFDACFRNAADYRSGKAVSSRHFEPVGTKTCQVLIEGDYNGIFRAGEHYISVRRDLSNMPEALEQLADEPRRLAIVNRAWDHVMSAHTHAHRVRELVREATA